MSERIVIYLNFGLSHREILTCLRSIDGIIISLRTLAKNTEVSQIVNGTIVYTIMNNYRVRTR